MAKCEMYDTDYKRKFLHDSYISHDVDCYRRDPQSVILDGSSSLPDNPILGLFNLGHFEISKVQ